MAPWNPIIKVFKLEQTVRILYRHLRGVYILTRLALWNNHGLNQSPQWLSSRHLRPRITSKLKWPVFFERLHLLRSFQLISTSLSISPPLALYLYLKIYNHKYIYLNMHNDLHIYWIARICIYKNINIKREGYIYIYIYICVYRYINIYKYINI